MQIHYTWKIEDFQPLSKCKDKKIDWKGGESLKFKIN